MVTIFVVDYSGGRLRRLLDYGAVSEEEQSCGCWFLMRPSISVVSSRFSVPRIPEC